MDSRLLASEMEWLLHPEGTSKRARCLGGREMASLVLTLFSIGPSNFQEGMSDRELDIQHWGLEERMG